MSPTWEPNRHAVHRLIQIVDVLAIAFNRFRQRSFNLPDYQPPLQFDTPGWQAGVAKLNAEFNEIRMVLFGGTITPAREADRLAYEAVAKFAADGARDEGTQAAVARAAEWVGAVGTPWVIGTPRPWDYGNDLPGRYEEAKRREDRFEREFEVLQQYQSVRGSLILALARTGQAVPAEVYERQRWAYAPYWEGEQAPITQAALLALTRETRDSGRDLQPTGAVETKPIRSAVAEPVPSASTPGSVQKASDPSYRILEDLIGSVSAASSFENAHELVRTGREVWNYLVTIRTVQQDEHRKSALNVRAAQACRDAMGYVPFGTPAFAEWERRLKAVARACALAIRHQGAVEQLDQLLETVGDLENAIVALAASAASKPAEFVPAVPPTETSNTPVNPPVGREDVADGPAQDGLTPTQHAILEVLSRATEPLQNAKVAGLAGYKDGTLRHAYRVLKARDLVRSTRDGYVITPAGRALVPSKAV